ncbi:hypothetical protein BRC89_02170 [Halobacteriales archaeon QS_4_70_19]|nr:MAG: hypothetical protein BRC89_02170 [Halobacteriales archaeon QS_4_70_19]
MVRAGYSHPPVRGDHRERRGAPEIPGDLVREEAVAAAAEDLRDTQLEKLSEHHRAVYAIIEESSPINRPTLYERYQ